MIALWISASREIYREARVYRNILKMVDSIREMRAMALVALPFPPLPVEVQKVASDSLIADGVEVINTHDLFAQCINACAAREDKDLNSKRKENQIKVLREFLADLCHRGLSLEGEDLYRLYCEHSYKHICTYFRENDKPEVKFMPYSYIAKGDKCHKKLIEHFIAQGILFEEKDISNLSKKAGGFTVGRILCMMRERLIMPGPNSEEGLQPSCDDGP